MCGIYGTSILYDKSIVERKLKRIAYRGPDYSGIKIFKSQNYQIILGHNRLAILDLDQRSNQPFTYYDNIHIVYNGEIYNYLEVKKELEKKNYTFRTTSDTEVICAAYLEYGESCVNHFNGMFAFVIYDYQRQLLFGARDRLGQKPLYFYHNGTHFEFASQISAISISNNRLSISEAAISDYFIWGYIPDPNSIFKEVKKLPAGHSFVFNIDTGRYFEKKYWDINTTKKNRFLGSYEEAKEQLEAILYDAVQKRMIADVPVGIFLSGGIDSSLIASLAKKSNHNDVKTFSVKFDVKKVDESIYASKVANHLRTNHHIIQCNYNEGIDLIENYHKYFDEPFADSSAIPSMLLSKYTREHVTVALSGDGGDESFLGYHRYKWVKIAKPFYNIPKALWPIMVRTLNSVPYYKSKVIASVLKSASLNEAYLNMITNSNSAWLKIKLKNDYPYYQKYLDHESKNIYERISDFDLKTYLNGDINTKVDRASMAFSLEARSPFLDYRVVEFGRSLPTKFKYQNKTQKKILKDILYKHVPENFFNRPKAGFTMPIKEWFRAELKEYVYDNLNHESLKSIPGIDFEVVEKMIEEHMNKSWNRSAMIWRLLVLKNSLSNISS